MEDRKGFIIGFILIFGVTVLASRGNGASALPDVVARTSSATDAISKATTTLTQDASDLITKYQLTNAGRCALLVAGLSSSDTLSINFVPGPTPIAALQADAIVGPGITVTGITAGPAAIAAGKGVQSAPVTGAERFIVFGINLNSIGAGNVANVKFDLTGASAGPHILALTNFVASDAKGGNVPLCTTTGVITK